MSEPASGGAPDSAFDATRFRQVLGHFPTGVTVVTAATADGPVGLAVGSFTSVSLDPPLVAFCPGRHSTSWPKIRDAGAFCVNILAADQEDTCAVFAGKSEDKFAGLRWREATASGAPILDGVVAWIDCRIDAVHEAGDHWIVVGEVLGLDVAREAPPMVFCLGGYGRFEP